MPVHPTLSDVRRSFASLVRTDVKRAAGSDNALDASEASTLSPFLQSAVSDLGPGSPAGTYAVNDVVDAAMARAALGWGAVNQPSGPGSAVLSQAEIATLTHNDPDLGAVTAAAAQLAFRKVNPLVVTLENAPAGVTLDKSGSKFTVSADSSVAVGASFNLTIDGQPLLLKRGPAGITVDELVAPEGYGLEVLARTVMTEPVQTATLQITKDDPTWLKPAQQKKKATAGLLDYVKHTRIHDADWQQSFPTTWAGNVAAGIPAQIAGFVSKSDTHVERSKDSVMYVGRGPFDLYTEITVSKKDGKVLHVLVEID